MRESLDYGRPNACNLCHLNQTLAWTADKLHTWYNQPMPELSAEDQNVAAGAQWIIKGDAGLLAFKSLDDVGEAAKMIRADYKKHSGAARRIAREVFEAETVLKLLLQRAGI